MTTNTANAVVWADCPQPGADHTSWYILLIQTHDTAPDNVWALPGAPLPQDADLEETARTAVNTQTGLYVRQRSAQQIGTWADRHRVPGERDIATAYGYVTHRRPSDMPPRPLDCAVRATWMLVADVLDLMHGVRMFADHREMVARAYQMLRNP